MFKNLIVEILLKCDQILKYMMYKVINVKERERIGERESQVKWICLVVTYFKSIILKFPKLHSINITNMYD